MRDKEDAKKREKAAQLQEDLKLHKEAARYSRWGKDKTYPQEGATQQASSPGPSQVFDGSHVTYDVVT